MWVMALHICDWHQLMPSQQMPGPVWGPAQRQGRLQMASQLLVPSLLSRHTIKAVSAVYTY